MKLPNFGYHLARAEARAIRTAYAATLSGVSPGTKSAPHAVDLDLCSYSSEASLREQVASIRSFLRHAGRPRSFTVYSDGTHSADSLKALRGLDRCVQVAAVPRPEVKGATASMCSYWQTDPTGRQLALMMSLPVERPTLYVDSDVLFFAGAKNIEESLCQSSARALYLSDCQLSADERLFHSIAERGDAVNTGIIFFRAPLDWSVAVERLRELQGSPTFFTNQTLTHLVMHANNAAPLDPRKFVLQLDDQFIYRDLHARPEIIARHYVNPVRHKFWTALL